MNIEDKNEWIEALTSGEYKQGKSYLCTKSGQFCCLGVLADLHDDFDQEFGEWSKGHAKTIEGFSSYPPRVWIEDRGLKDSQVDTLVSMNDAGRDFFEIANWIRNNV